MKTVLFINGCVRQKHSRTLVLAQTYIESLKSQFDFELVERNLCQEDITFLSSGDFNAETGEPYPHKDCSLAEEFARADEIVFAAPFWEFLFPAIVNCYFEMVSVVGVTFKYTDKGSVGLCNANSMTYLYSAGDHLSDADKISEQYLSRLCELYNIPHFSAISAQGLDIQSNSAETIMREVCEKIMQTAK